MSYPKRFATIEAAMSFIDTLPIKTVQLLLAEFLTEPATRKITISEDEFYEHFRIRGRKENGELENRGRPKREE